MVAQPLQSPFNSRSWFALSKMVVITELFRYEQLFSRHRCTSSHPSTDSSVGVSIRSEVRRSPTGTRQYVSLNCLSCQARLSSSRQYQLRPSRFISSLLLSTMKIVFVIVRTHLHISGLVPLIGGYDNNIGFNMSLTRQSIRSILVLTIVGSLIV